VVDGQLAPDGNEEYRLYQLLMGAWPANGRIDERFVERIIAAVVKAANEAGVHSAWSNPQDDWLTALASFTTSLLHDDAPGGFVASFGPRAHRIAELGMTNTLAQLVLKVTSPGVPDCYQGQEIVELTLVDPDNRRAVDYDMRRALLGDADARTWPALIDSWETGAIKLRVLRDLLRFRAAHPRLFRDGDYRPLPVRGAHAGRIVAFSRSAGAERLVVVVPRLTAGFGWPPLGAVWEDTAVELEDRQAARDVLTGLAVEARPLPVSEAFSVLPVAVLQG
jgi:(1->4)-alpha-D-glucan 1-alpha-D-glucosylmutase